LPYTTTGKRLHENGSAAGSKHAADLASSLRNLNVMEYGNGDHEICATVAQPDVCGVPIYAPNLVIDAVGPRSLSCQPKTLVGDINGCHTPDEHSEFHGVQAVSRTQLDDNLPLEISRQVEHVLQRIWSVCKWLAIPLDVRPWHHEWIVRPLPDDRVEMQTLVDKAFLKDAIFQIPDHTGACEHGQCQRRHIERTASPALFVEEVQSAKLLVRKNRKLNTLLFKPRVSFRYMFSIPY
jgi:hypothetical protein